MSVESCFPTAYNAILSIQSSPVDNNPVTEPVTLDELKAYAHIDTDITEDDAVLTSLITTARQMLEIWLNTGLVLQKREVAFINGMGNIMLPMPPLTGSITFSAPAGSYSIVPDDAHSIGLNVISPAGTNEPFTATYNSGFAEGELPGMYKTAICAQAAYMYAHKGDEQNTDDGFICTKAQQILQGVRMNTNIFIL